MTRISLTVALVATLAVSVEVAAQESAPAKAQVTTETVQSLETQVAAVMQRLMGSVAATVRTTQGGPLAPVRSAAAREKGTVVLRAGFTATPSVRPSNPKAEAN